MKILWLHRVWSVFWNIFGITISILLVVGLVSFGVLQLPASKSYIVKKVEQRFNTQHVGVLSLGKLEGTLPFNFKTTNIHLYPDSSSITPLFSADSISASLDFLALFSNRFIITGLDVVSPKVVLDINSQYSVANTIKRKETTKIDSIISESPSFVEILAPSVNVYNGEIVLKNLSENSLNLDSLSFEDISLNMFLDYNRTGRFVDIDELAMAIPGLDIENLNLFGQIFNNEQFLEFNAFNIELGGSRVSFTGEANGVDLLKQDIASQLQNAELKFAVSEFLAEKSVLKKFIHNYPDYNQSLYFTLESEGNLDSLWVDDFQIIFGESAVDGYGIIKNPFNLSNLEYEVSLSNIVIDSSEVFLLKDDFSTLQLETLVGSSYEIDVSGDKNELIGKIEVVSSKGFVEATGKVGLNSDIPSEILVTLDSLDVGGLFFPQLASSNLTGQIDFKSNSLKDLSNAEGKGEVRLTNGELNGINYTSLSVIGDFKKGIITPVFELESPLTNLSGMGTISLQDSVPQVEFSGKGRNLDLKALTQLEQMSSSLIDVEYELFLEGNSFDNVFGQVTLDIPLAIVSGDTLTNHQFYADFNEPLSDNRTLRVTSTAFDFSMDGVFNPSDIFHLSPYWSTYLGDRVNEEILFKEKKIREVERPEVIDQNFSVDLTIKNLALLQAYFPNIPKINSTAHIQSNINVNTERLLFNGSVTDNLVEYKAYKADSINSQITGSFRYGESLKTFSGLKIVTDLAGLDTDYISGDGVLFSFEMNEDSVQFSQTINKIAQDTKFNLDGNVQLTDSLLTMRISDFGLGSDIYKWENSGVPTLSFAPKGRLIFKGFTFTNLDEFINLEGAFSNNPLDSVNYLVRSVNLERISNLINGKIDFFGELDGRFTTRSLTRLPTIQGELNIFAFGIDDNVVGDININSTFNQPLNRFDTNVSINTDSVKYPQYYIRNTRLGQDIELNGYVLAPENGQFPKADSLFKFDLDFENIDLWIIPFIIPKVFSEMSGVATGKGYVWGNLDTYDFNVDYEVGMNDAVYMKPKFLDTYYYGQGMVSFTREKGLDFKDMFVIDPSGGTAIVSGTYNLNDFNKIHSIDLQLDMDEFQFLNSSFDPNIAFFGKAYGSSIIRMTGTNLNPVLETVNPVYISDFSNIGIPLLEETEFDEDNKFIRFVDDFSFNKKGDLKGSENTQLSTQQSEENPFDRTFVERFTMDLQFIATNPMTVQLIFDPITGDIITADGTGRLQIRLQDEELSMFGRFDITGGNYQFVSGDIFTRRFELERGGYMTWEGAPTDATLNLSATYQARPDINTLTRARSDISQETAQRVPVQLVLNIGGSLSAIENDFFFRLPNTFESGLNTTLSTQINTLNRNEDEKLIQATSFLLMGDFIPSTSATTDGTNSLTDNFSGSSAVLNPLLSSQVISPLLSNQINSLLRSDVGSLDIDFNLNTYNNVDLAVALRLYNDRIILSREGQITGSQSNIGDLGATYRINQTLSVTAFHRQDPTFSNFGTAEESQQAQDINGVGLEAEVSFNSWREFLNRIGRPFRKFFGIKKKEEDNSQNQTENSPS